MKIIKDYLEARRVVYKELGLDELYYNLEIEGDVKWNGNRDFVSWVNEGRLCSEEVKQMIVSENHVTFLVYGCLGGTYYMTFDKTSKDESLEE
jgi:hypothetical protein